MSVRASCGHLLADDESEGPDGLGWRLAVRDYSREGTPAVRYGSYCTSCRESAMSDPGHILVNEAAEFAWLASDTPSASAAAGAAEPTGYGVWSIWASDPRCTDDEGEARLIGTYRGFVDAIAFHVAWSDRDVAYFKREPNATAAEEVSLPAYTDELAECVGVNILQEKGMLADDKSAIEAFFKGRPVFAKYSGWGNCVALFHEESETGARYIEERAQLRKVLAKLTPEDIAILQDNGLRE
jgi:hypothetical protein